MSPQMLADYLQRREKLITEDRALRIDHVRANYTTAELKADEVVRSIRAREAITVWGINYEHVPHPYPGMEFLNAKDIILQTDLYSKIVSKVSIESYRASCHRSSRSQFPCRCQRVGYYMYTRTPRWRREHFLIWHWVIPRYISASRVHWTQLVSKLYCPQSSQFLWNNILPPM
ncbi:hypothetical protein BDR03DRAFT_583480 [Suillus americanus]|nr:hypothetical protein BDR03DRAFT_583480 [Suillus americanus]